MWIFFLKEADDLDNDGDEEGEPDDVENKEEGHEEVEDVVDGEHLNQLQIKLNLKPDDMEDEEEGHEEVEDVVDGEHLNQLQRKLNLDIVCGRRWFHQDSGMSSTKYYRLQTNKQIRVPIEPSIWFCRN